MRCLNPVRGGKVGGGLMNTGVEGGSTGETPNTGGVGGSGGGTPNTGPGTGRIVDDTAYFAGLRRDEVLCNLPKPIGEWCSTMPRARW